LRYPPAAWGKHHPARRAQLLREREFKRTKVILAPQTKDLAHLHSGPFFDFPIEIKELSAQLSRRRFADRRFPDAGKSNENQMRR